MSGIEANKYSRRSFFRNTALAGGGCMLGLASTGVTLIGAADHLLNGREIDEKTDQYLDRLYGSIPAIESQMIRAETGKEFEELLSKKNSRIVASQSHRGDVRTIYEKENSGRSLRNNIIMIGGILFAIFGTSLSIGASESNPVVNSEQE